MMKKISMKLTALALALTLLWGMLPAPGRAQAAQPAEQRYAELIAGTEAAFLLAFNGGVYPLNEDNEPADAPAASLDTETQYPFVWGEALWIVDKGKGDTRQLYPEGNADSAFALNITDDLASGAEDWYLSDVRMEDGALYFLLGIPWQEYPALCRYRMAEKTYDHVTLPGLRAYVPQGAGQGLAVCEDGDETLVYGIDWADQQPQISLRLQGRWEAFAWDGDTGLLYAADTQGQAFVRFRANREEARAQSPYAGSAEAGAVRKGQYLVARRSALYQPDFDAASGGGRVLTVLYGFADEADMQFMKDNPGVRVEYLRG